MSTCTSHCLRILVTRKAYFVFTLKRKLCSRTTERQRERGRNMGREYRQMRRARSLTSFRSSRARENDVQGVRTMPGFVFRTALAANGFC